MASFLGLDIGTSSVKGVLLDTAQRLVAEASAPLEVQRPHPLWSEQDPEAWWRATQSVVASLRASVPDAWSGLEAIGLSGQMHGATLLDQEGQVLRPAILWNDGRSEAECRWLTAHVPEFHQRSSNLAMPGFTAPKLLWVARHEPELFQRLATVLLPKDYVRFRMSDALVSDLSDSAGTLWLDIGGRAWDPVLLDACGLSTSQMPRLVEGSAVSAELSAEVARAWGLGGRRVPIAGGGGDNAASAVGIGAVNPGDGFLSLGTSGVLFVAADHLVALPSRTLHAFCHALPDRWHGMAVMLSGASALTWFAGIAAAASDIGRLVASAEAFSADPARVAAAPVFLPYLTGERTPHNDPAATASFAGLRAGHEADALAYAVLEGVGFGLADCLDVLVESGAAPSSCMLVGGGARSTFWAQLVSDCTGLALDIPDSAELGAAFGAARLGMLSVGGNVASVCTKPRLRAQIRPRADVTARLQPRRERMRSLYRGFSSDRP